MQLQHVLVAVDGSEPSRKAARFAHDLAQKVGARLTLLLVLEPPRVLPLGPLDAFGVMAEPLSPAQVQAARDVLDDIAADLPAAQVDKRVEVGMPADTIVQQAAQLGVQLVVVGDKGHGAMGRWLLGSTTDRVVHHAGCPVTVVR